MKPPILYLALALFAAIPVAASAASAAISAFTKHDYEKCKLVKRDIASQTRRCKGLAGIAVNYFSDDDNSVIDFGSEGRVGEGSYGAEFVFAGKTVEWRGVRKRGVFAPYAAIVRFDLGQSIGGPFRPRLIIFRLESRSRSCIAASVDGRRAAANERARQLADGFGATFDCAKDKARPLE
ncbi:MAG: hypothetical protein ACHQAY_06995 [Hyphomicrobiales bacterium]